MFCPWSSFSPRCNWLHPQLFSSLLKYLGTLQLKNWFCSCQKMLTPAWASSRAALLPGCECSRCCSLLCRSCFHHFCLGQLLLPFDRCSTRCTSQFSNNQILWSTLAYILKLLASTNPSVMNEISFSSLDMCRLVMWPSSYKIYLYKVHTRYFYCTKTILNISKTSTTELVHLLPFSGLSLSRAPSM